jgi:hypothetical protein
VFGEKTREDAIRMSTGYSCVRIIWADFDRPRTTTTGILRMMRFAA